MTLTEIRRLLSESGLRLTKSLGQNFLHDQNQLRKIVAAAELTKTDKVLEIGPGLGPLTELLLKAAGEVLAIEKDARLLEILRERFPAGQASCLSPMERTAALRRQEQPDTNSPNQNRIAMGGRPVLHLLHDDALDYLQREPRDWSDWKMVSNLPYSVASPILVELAQSDRGPRRIVATLQIEVARRLAAKADDADYGVLTLLVQLNYRPSLLSRIPATCFYPEPDVDSACVCLVRRPAPLLAPNHRPVFVQIVKQAFSQRRKMMLKLLKAQFPGPVLDDAFQRAGLPPQARAESVSLEQFIGLTQTLAGDSGRD
ncbi:MAG TPA: 16S rRNA (adenine(1518)-N(6)/adenine(1519)-N(6))-dimethyltransferase RsmA [Verrucomicrobiae bacterium]